jgi:hypothetical protein
MAERKTWWWIRQAGLIILGGFYLYFGIRMLIGAYTLDNPLSFIMTFFASNLIILISAVLIVGFVYRLIVVIRQPEENPKSEAPDSDPADDEIEPG